MIQTRSSPQQRDRDLCLQIRGLHGSGVTDAEESGAQIFVFSGSGKNCMAALNLEEQHTWGFSGAYTAFRMMIGVETVNGKTVFVIRLSYSANQTHACYNTIVERY